MEKEVNLVISVFKFFDISDMDDRDSYFDYDLDFELDLDWIVVGVI